METGRAIEVENRVLVLGDDSRATLAMVRSLGRRGVEVHLGTSSPSNPVASSRYVRRVVTLPSPHDARSAWLSALETSVREIRYDLVMPATEGTTVPLLEERVRIEAIVPCALPTSESFQKVFDKRESLALMRELNVPTPTSRIVEDKEMLERSLAQHPLPVVVKPSVSRVWRDDMEIGLGVRIAKTIDEARAMTLELLPDAPVILQEYVEGIGVGQEFLCRNGEIMLEFQHDRIREFQGSGGSTLRVSAAMHKEMKAASQRLLMNLKWDGVAMVEYRSDPETGKFVCIEINGRFWGSLPLPVALKVDFPYDFYAYRVLGHVVRPVAYRADIYARNIAEDIRQYFKSGGNAIGAISEYGEAFWRLCTGEEYWNVLARDDVRPALTALARIFQRAGSKVAGGTGDVLSSLRSRDVERALIQEQFPQARHVMFMCFGNINRSAFAEKYLRKYGPHNIEVLSAGHYQRTGRPATQQAKDAAAKYSVSLEEHQSSVLTKEMASWADIILVMDSMQIQWLAKNMPETADKVHYLGAVLPNGTPEIRDPDQLSDNVFDTVFQKIARSIDILLAAPKSL